MTVSEGLPIIVAVVLAAIAALESSNARTQQEVRRFLATALEPQTTDLDSDPGYMRGVATGAEWLPAADAAPNHIESRQPRL